MAKIQDGVKSDIFKCAQPVVFWRETHEFQSSFFHEKTSTLLYLMIERCNLFCTLKEIQDLTNSSLATTKLNQNCQYDRTHF